MGDMSQSYWPRPGKVMKHILHGVFIHKQFLVKFMEILDNVLTVTLFFSRQNTGMRKMDFCTMPSFNQSASDSSKNWCWAS
jgi:hypothetical protein